MQNEDAAHIFRLLSQLALVGGREAPRNPSTLHNSVNAGVQLVVISLFRPSLDSLPQHPVLNDIDKVH